MAHRIGPTHAAIISDKPAWLDYAASFSPVAVLAAALIAAGVGVVTLWQKSRADRRAQ